MKKGLLILLFISALITVSGCRRDSEEKLDPIPTISNPDHTFVEFDGISISSEMLYKQMKASEGITHLINYVDLMVLSDVIDNLDADRIEDERLRMKYGTTDQTVIDEIREDEERYEEIELSYYYNMIFAGFNPDSPGDVERFVALSLAQRDVTIDAAIEAYDATHLHSLARNRYQSESQGDITAIELIFRSNEEFTSTMHLFDLVPDYQGGIGEYFGDTPIENLRRADFNEHNTRLLNEEEVFDVFINIYNYLFPYRETIDLNTSLADIDSFTGDNFIFNYDDMSSQRELQRVAEILFSELDVDSNRFTMESRRYHLNAPHLEGYRAMYFLLAQEDVTPFDDLAVSEQDEYKRNYVRGTINQQNQIRTMIDLRTEAGFVLHDRILHFTYKEMLQQVYPSTVSEHAKYQTHDSGIVASINGETISTDDYFGYMLRRIGAVSVVELYKELWLIESDYFEDVYGEERNLQENDDPTIVEYRNVIQDFKDQMEADMPWEHALQMIGFADEASVLRYLVVGELLNHLVVPNLDYERAVEHVQKVHENYISLKVEHILVYIDMDGDLAPDNFTDYITDLESEGGVPWATYLDKVNRLETLITTRINQGMSLQSIVDEYRVATRDESANPWAEFKNFGFKLRYENLTQGENIINATNVERFVAPFKDRLYELYHLYQTEPYEDVEKLLDPNGFFPTEFGLHFVRVEKGSEDNFYPLSAAFEDPNGDYDADWLNDSDVPSEAQLRLWAEHAFKRSFTLDGSDIEVPESVDEALNLYFDNFLGRHFPLPQEEFDPFGNIIIIDRFIENEIDFAVENVHLQGMIRALKDLYENVIYSD